MKNMLVLLILGAVLFISCQGMSNNKTSSGGSGEKIIMPDKFPETKIITNTAGKELVEHNTVRKNAGILFQTDAKIRSAVLINDGKLYFGNEACNFYAVDINTKRQLWVYKTDEAVQTLPVFADEKIIFNAGNTLYILNASNGKELSKVIYPSRSSRRLSYDSYSYNDSHTAIHDGIAYFAAGNGDVVAVDINKGEIVWTIPAASPGVVGSGLSVYNGRLYWSDFFGTLRCVDISTRQPVFQTVISDRIFAPMLICDGKIFVAGRSCKIYCIDANSGDVIWLSYSSVQTSWFTGGSVCTGDTIYTCTSDGFSLLAFDKETGDFKRTYPTTVNGYTKPVLNGNNIIIAATDVYRLNRSFIMEFDTKNHTKLWEVSLSEGVLSSPAIYNGTVYFGSDSGNIYSIDLN